MLIPWPLPLPGAFVLAVALLLALLVALAVDRWLGEPPVRLHPVVWMGNYLGWAGKHLQSVTRQADTSPDFRAFWLGALVWLAGAAIVFIATLALQWGAMALPTAVGAVVMGLLLKPLLAWAMLKGEVLAVEKALTPAQGGSLITFENTVIANTNRRLGNKYPREIAICCLFPTPSNTIDE